MIKKSLKPAWNETFCIPAATVQQALAANSALLFEIWGQKQLGKPGLLGQVWCSA